MHDVGLAALYGGYETILQGKGDRLVASHLVQSKASIRAENNPNPPVNIRPPIDPG